MSRPEGESSRAGVALAGWDRMGASGGRIGTRPASAGRAAAGERDPSGRPPAPDLPPEDPAAPDEDALAGSAEARALAGEAEAGRAGGPETTRPAGAAVWDWPGV
ncbi:hypothetical protein [Frankia gtarii]|uniref:hypothetical protein n=1 Tax=Frankia gtarii TaxID=2950102 RepID=UPI0021BFBC8D|nr:hypothetical protein [Frankia gtarii]